MDRKFEGRVALVTGASRGIGRAVALQLAREGAAVCVNYRARAQAALETVDQIQHSGGRAIAVQADVADRAAVRAMENQTATALGAVDILVNNAGLMYPGTLLDFKEDELDQMWQTNVKGVLHVTAAVAPKMIERKYGRVINVSSIAAVGTGHPGTTLYAATKAAVQILTRRLAFELGPSGITVNAVLPGLTLTDMVAGGMSQHEIQKMLDGISAKSMLRRTGVPEDIARVICFLASDDSSFMTGQSVAVDGGRMDFLSQT